MNEAEYNELVKTYTARMGRLPTYDEMQKLIEGDSKKTNSTKLNFLLKILGFILGFGIFFIMEFVLVTLLGALFDIRFHPRGARWILLPIAGGIAGASLLSFSSTYMRQGINVFKNSVALRALFIGSLFWAVVVISYVWLFEPFVYMRNEDYYTIAKIVIFPPVVLIVAYLLYIRFVKR